MFRKLCFLGVVLCFLFLLLGLPSAALSQAPQVNNVLVSALPQGNGEITLDHLAALTSFYQTIIGVLVTVIGLLATLSFLTIRHLSKTAAEDMAVEAARRVISDSNAFREDVAVIVDESVNIALSEVQKLRSGVDSLTKAIAAIDRRIDELPGGGGVVVDPRREGE